MQKTPRKTKIILESKNKVEALTLTNVKAYQTAGQIGIRTKFKIQVWLKAESFSSSLARDIFAVSRSQYKLL